MNCNTYWGADTSIGTGSSNVTYAPNNPSTATLLTLEQEWVNTVSGEVFVPTSLSPARWVGQLGTVVEQPSVVPQPSVIFDVLGDNSTDKLYPLSSNRSDLGGVGADAVLTGNDNYTNTVRAEFDFDGFSYMYFPDVPLVNRTLSFNFKINNSSNTNVEFFGNYIANSLAFRVARYASSPDKLTITTGGGALAYYVYVPINDFTVSHHLTFVQTYNTPTLLEIYLDGIFVVASAVVGLTTLSMKAGWDNLADKLFGQISMVRFISRAVTDVEALTIYSEDKV